MMGLDVYIAGALIGCIAFTAGMRILNAVMGTGPVRGWMPAGSERDEKPEPTEGGGFR